MPSLFVEERPLFDKDMQSKNEKPLPAVTGQTKNCNEQKVLRIVLKQREANYSFGESVVSKMTYPLPPFSTVIGALHKACGYTEYHPMDISVQGGFHSKEREVYRAVIPMATVQNDRDILVYTAAPGKLGNGYIIVAEANSQGAKIKSGDKTTVYDKTLHRKYADECAAKNLDPHFMTINKGMRYYESLYDINLVLHLRTDATTAADIQNNIGNMTALGRSEDFAEIVSCDEVALTPITDNAPEVTLPPGFGGYVHPLFLDKDVLTAPKGQQFDVNGTLLHIPKNYKIVKEGKNNSVGIGRREFCKKWAVWVANYTVDDQSGEKLEDLPLSLQNRLFLDLTVPKGYIVDFF